MIQTHLFITETYINKSKLYPFLSDFFFQSKPWPILLEKPKMDTHPELEKDFIRHQNQGQILLPEFESKKDFRSQILDFYKNYNHSTLLFLGDIGEFSIPMQEGLLKLLEEPPKNLNIVLLAPGSYKILPTITSRCQTHFLAKEYIYDLLDPQLVSKVQKNLLRPSDLITSILQNKKPSLLEISKNISKLERSEIDLWLWQVLESLNLLYQKQNSQKVAKLIGKVISARKYNQQNLQKKLVLASLLEI